MATSFPTMDAETLRHVAGQDHATFAVKKQILPATHYCGQANTNEAASGSRPLVGRAIFPSPLLSPFGTAIRDLFSISLFFGIGTCYDRCCALHTKPFPVLNPMMAANCFREFTFLRTKTKKNIRHPPRCKSECVQQAYCMSNDFNVRGGGGGVVFQVIAASDIALQYAQNYKNIQSLFFWVFCGGHNRVRGTFR